MVADVQDLASLSARFGVDLSRMARGIGFLAIALASLEVLAGALVLRRSNAGRILGIVLAIHRHPRRARDGRRGGGSGTLVLVINGFVVYVLFAYGHVFDHVRGG